MVADDIVRIALEQSLKLLPRIFAAPFFFVLEGKQNTVIDECITQKHAAFGAKLVLCGGNPATSRTA